MRLTHPTFQEMLIIDGIDNTMLVVENPRQLTSYMMELKDQINGEDGRFGLFDDDGADLDFGKVELIIDPFSLDINSRKIISGVMSQIDYELKSEQYYERLNELLSHIESFADDVLSSVDIRLRCSELKYHSFIKLLSPYFENRSGSLSEILIDYMELATKYAGIRLFIITNMRDFLSLDEYGSLCRNILYSKLNVLFIESKVVDDPSITRGAIIDKDLCEISLGGGLERNIYN